MSTTVHATGMAERRWPAAARAMSAPSPGPWLAATVALACGLGLAAGFQYAVYVLTAIGFAATIIGVRFPGLGLMAVGLLCTLDPVMNGLVFTGGLLRWNTFNYFLLAVSLFWLPLFLRRRDPSLLLIQLCALLLGLELAISADPARGLQDLLGLCAVFGLVTFTTRARLKRADWFWLGVVCGTLSTLGGFVYYLQLDSLAAINPNAWAYFPVTALFAICLALPCSWEFRYGPVTLATLASVSLVWVFMSGSRGSMLIGLACAAYLIVTVPGIRGRFMVLAIGALLALAATLQFSSLQQQALERIRLLADQNTPLVDRTSHRSELMLAGFYLFQEHPLGVGTGGFTGALRDLGRRDGISLIDPYRGKAAHSGWVKLLAENGLPGVLLMLLFVGSFSVRGWRLGHRSTWQIGLLTTAVLAAAFLSNEYQSKGLWLIAAGGIAMVSRGSPLLRQGRE